MKAGWFMNLICVVVICVLMQTWGNVILDVKTFPSWAIAPTEATENPCFVDSSTVSWINSTFFQA